MTAKAKFVLEDGKIFEGISFGAVGTAFGEAVFSTGMSGYQETLTDPSYHQQVVVMTAPHIGNTGMNKTDEESRKIWVSGFVVREPSPMVSNWRSESSLDDELKAAGVVGVAEVDTRAITRHLRERGAMRVGLFSGDAAEKSDSELVELVKNSPQMKGANLTEAVTTESAYVVKAVGQKKYTVAAVDLGIKSMTPELMAERGIEVHVVPGNISITDLLAIEADGIFFSNGPGDPATADHAVALATAVLEAKKPFFGICFGNQILGRALGFETYKLKYGHRGINQPVQDKTTGKVEVTAHNHGFAVKAPLEGETKTKFGRVIVSHVCLNDDVVEGLECLDQPAFSVQYHPEAAAGPHDSAYLFDRFCEMMDGTRNA